MARHNRIRFSVPEPELLTAEQLTARGIAFDEVTGVRDGYEVTLLLPRLPRRIHTCAGPCWCMEETHGNCHDTPRSRGL